jgi:hypothetical protein
MEIILKDIYHLIFVTNVILAAILGVLVVK